MLRLVLSGSDPGDHHQVRNTQLEKEARELRAESASLQDDLERSKHEAVSNERVLPSPPANLPSTPAACSRMHCT